jgi:hypothetical protein
VVLFEKSFIKEIVLFTYYSLKIITISTGSAYTQMFAYLAVLAA